MAVVAFSPSSRGAELPPFAEFHKLLVDNCTSCHGPEKQQSGIDYTTFISPEHFQENLEVLEATAWVLEEHEMPPIKAKKQPTDAERETLIAWVQGTLLAMQNTSPNDPGLVVMPRLTNREFDNVLSDLTGKTISVANLLPGEPVAGEGFSNVGQAQDISPTRVEKYLSAASRALAHARITPVQGIRWFDDEISGGDSAQSLREGLVDEWTRLHRSQEELLLGTYQRPRYEPYLSAIWQYRHRQAQGKPNLTLAELAAQANPPLALTSLEMLWNLFVEGKVPPSVLEDVYQPWLELPPSANQQALAEAIKKVDERRKIFAARDKDQERLEVSYPRDKRYATKPIQEKSFSLALPQVIGGPAQTIRLSKLTAHFADKTEREIKGPFETLVVPGRYEIPVEPNAIMMTVELDVGDAVNDQGFAVGLLVGKDADRLAAQDLQPLKPLEISKTNAQNVWLRGGLGNRVKTNRSHLRDVFGVREYFAGSPFMLERQYTLFFKDLDGALDLELFGKNKWTGWDIEADRAKANSYFTQLLDKLYLTRPDYPFYLSAEDLRRNFTPEAQKQREQLYADMEVLQQKPHTAMAELARANGMPEIVEGQVPPADVVAKWPSEARQKFHAIQARLTEQETLLSAAARRQITQFASKAWQNPVEPQVSDQLLQIFLAKRAVGGSYDAAVKQALKAVLISPQFLFRTVHVATAGEGLENLDNRELADRMAGLFWASRPDEALLAADLSDPAQLEAQMNRMLADNRSRSLASEFVGYWLGFAGFTEHLTPNPNKFPTYDEELRNDMYEEAILFFQDLFRENRPVSNIYSADYTFVNQRLAKHYGLQNKVWGKNFQRVQVDPSQRGGIFGMGSVLTKTSTALRTSPVLRGVWILTAILGEPLPEPPPGVPALSEDSKDEQGRTITEQLAKHREDASCASCHDRIDPPGIALENFDPIGRWRTDYEGDSPIDPTTQMRDGTTMNGLSGLRAYLQTKDESFVENFCHKLIGYALARPFLITDKSLVQDMKKALAANNGQVKSALLVLLQSPQFQQKRVTPQIVAAVSNN